MRAARAHTGCGEQKASRTAAVVRRRSRWECRHDSRERGLHTGRGSSPGGTPRGALRGGRLGRQCHGSVSGVPPSWVTPGDSPQPRPPGGGWRTVPASSEAGARAPRAARTSHTTGGTSLPSQCDPARPAEVRTESPARVASGAPRPRRPLGKPRISRPRAGEQIQSGFCRHGGLGGRGDRPAGRGGGGGSGGSRARGGPVGPRGAGPAAGRMGRSAARGSGAAEAAARRSLPPSPARARRAAPP